MDPVPAFLDCEAEFGVKIRIFGKPFTELRWDGKAFKAVLVPECVAKRRGDPGLAADKGGNVGSRDTLEGRHDLDG